MATLPLGLSTNFECVDLTEIQMVGFGENLYIPLDKISAFRRK
jgi:hypothetical protein